MSTTPQTRFPRSRAAGAGRVLLGAVLAFAVIANVVFANGGACAALIMSEAAAHAAHDVPVSPSVSQGAGCGHRTLPPGHHHGTEQTCSATGSAGSPSFAAPGTSTEARPRQMVRYAGRMSLPGAAPEFSPVILHVMRI
ncbi:hypothetical protein GCM10009677_48790 [Sphaerisporangium rubeum]|uniref:Uncharacterized protein n=1 Tax=Sphaerisporangium rubeum TaxID=321317 RepID=A0A7X0M5G0_9ACTN|nr:hypothetical protein [Sphaerisporangium rubeum]MBB6470914.1 hypothetical protein [Sphaerisporangium rubeum]